MEANNKNVLTIYKLTFESGIIQTCSQKYSESRPTVTKKNNLQCIYLYYLFNIVLDSCIYYLECDFYICVSAGAHYDSYIVRGLKLVA